MTVVLFLISAALAVPTFGVSLLAFFIGKSVWDRLSADLLAKHAVLSVKNASEVYTFQRINAAAIRRFFNQLGTQVPRYTFHADLGSYHGEVALPEVGNFDVTVSRMGKFISIGAYDPAPKISVEGLLDGSFDKSFGKWLDKRGCPSPGS
jgi:hypothetical protein